VQSWLEERNKPRGRQLLALLAKGKRSPSPRFLPGLIPLFPLPPPPGLFTFLHPLPWTDPWPGEGRPSWCQPSMFGPNNNYWKGLLEQVLPEVPRAATVRTAQEQSQLMPASLCSLQSLLHSQQSLWACCSRLLAPGGTDR
jgi:hypothetical protein